MLQCRRHEKDFLARRDTAYVSRYVAAYDRVSVGAKDLDAAIPSLSSLRHMENYRLASHDIVLAMSEVGLTENEGLRGELRAAIQNAEQALEGQAHAHKDTHKRQPVTFEPARGAPGGGAGPRTQNCL